MIETSVTYVSAQTRLNVVRIDDGRYVEVQGTAETTPYRKKELDAMLSLADAGIDRLHVVQREIIGDALGRVLVTAK